MNSETTPSTPIAAATHPDPYPYYAELVSNKPLYYDEAVGAWIASSAEIVTSVLNHEHCKVRPANEPVPTALIGSPAGEIFRRLIRMNDGAGHCPLNRAVAETLASIAPHIAERSADWSHRLLGRYSVATDRADVTKFCFALSTHVLGSALGISEDRLSQTTAWMGEFVRCVFGAPDAQQLAQGKSAAGELWRLFEGILDAPDSGGGLLKTLLQASQTVGSAHRDSVIANGIGFLSQAHEATAGLISNSLLLLSRREDVRERVRADRKLLRDLTLEVLRFDPPTHSTRRFLIANTKLFDHELRAGEMIVVLVAAANRDPSANPECNRFELVREKRRIFTFGTGIHACPGDTIALTIAEAGISALLDSDLGFQNLKEKFTYRTSANTRIPLFDH